mgnify:CR=1 FL=1|jgi:hypothetical protein
MLLVSLDIQLMVEGCYKTTEEEENKGPQA